MCDAVNETTIFISKINLDKKKSSKNKKYITLRDKK